MALSKTSRVNSMKPEDAAKMLPKEVIKMAAEVRKSAGGGKKGGK